ncbi:hypothetical protein [Halioxenophilus sp. WMMB6]|uniref:MORN repeat-containing protein n=1 Tax=Halioxenophilus sp. WMMB6 TaxID=3073815 RepID=UPI00295E87B5|nr:hypothetical protein [Halioxenophilus sp. WMMB6]
MTVDTDGHSLPFRIAPAVASGVYLRLAFDQLLDSDLKPNPDDFSISLPLCEAGGDSTVRPIHLEIKNRDTDQGPLSTIILVLDHPLPPVSEMELHYHPLELLMWSNTTGDSIEPFILHLPVKLSRQEPKGALPAKLLESLANKAKKQKAPELPPAITHVEGNRINVCLNRQLIPHQGVAAGDFRAEAEDHWCTVTAAAIHQSGKDEPHEVQLGIKEKLEPGAVLTIAFKAKRYPMTALDGSQISSFKVSARYLGPGKIEALATDTGAAEAQVKADTEKYHLQALETILDDSVTPKQVWGGYLLNSLYSLTQLLGRPLSPKVNGAVSVSRTQKLMAIALGLIIIWLAIVGVRFIASFPSANRPAPVANTVGSDPDQLTSCRLNFVSGNKYTGTCNSANQPHGKGIFSWTSGSTYEGQFVNGKRSGQGIMSYPTGARYDGAWIDDKKHGRGTYWTETGDRFEGEFIDGKMTANGTCYKHDGTQVSGYCPT